MTAFDEYAAYYDLLYQEKNFAGEVNFVHGLVQRENPGAISLLDLGCGTGTHAAIFAEIGYTVHGVDRSSKMLAQAYLRRQTLAPGVRARLFFEQKDLRTLRLNKTFDAIVLLFHVISYQTSDSDLQAAFATVAAHLNPRGVVLWDFWYGPGVLADPPVPRLKTFEDENIRVSRGATPIMKIAENLVEVRYDVTVTQKLTRRCRRLAEIHRMRYLFKPELDTILERAGLVPIRFGEWLTEKTPGAGTWTAFLMATSPPAHEYQLQ